MVKEDEKLIIEDGVTVLEPLSFVDCKPFINAKI